MGQKTVDMEIPFLKNKQNNSGGGVIEKNVGDDALIDSVAQELMQAIEKKDVKGFRSALEALVLHIQDMDKEQDGE